MQSGSADSSVQKMKKVPHSFDDVWPAVLETISNQGWEIGSADKASGRIETEFAQVGFDEINSYARCPMGFDTQIMRGRMKIEVTVVKHSLYESSLGIAVSIHGWDEGTKKAWVNCDSTGEIEKIIIEGVERRLSIR